MAASCSCLKAQVEHTSSLDHTRKRYAEEFLLMDDGRYVHCNVICMVEAYIPQDCCRRLEKWKSARLWTTPTLTLNKLLDASLAHQEHELELQSRNTLHLRTCWDKLSRRSRFVHVIYSCATLTALRACSLTTSRSAELPCTTAQQTPNLGS